MAMEKITHFTHPNHTLSAITSIDGNYTCDGCKEPGSGKRFSCGTCHFNLHDYCARAPATLSSFMDRHGLRLTVYDRRMYCDVCSEPIDGMTYSCRDCNFDAHPGCTYYPQYIKLNVDARHYLKLQMDRTKCTCDICNQKCTLMRYSCRDCNVDVHVQCSTGRRPRPAAATTGDGGGERGIDGNKFIGIMKTTYKITSFVLDMTTGIPLPDIDFDD